MQSPKTTHETPNWKFSFIDDGFFDLNLDAQKYQTAVITKQNRFKTRIGFLAIESPPGTFLIDLGIGNYPYPLLNRSPSSPYISMQEKLKKYKIEQINGIIFSHLHADHLGGYMEFKDGHFTQNFPEIPCYVNEIEWNFRLDRLNKYEDSYKTYIDHLKPNIHLTSEDEEIHPGIRIFSTGGHTPGHQTILIEADDELIFYGGDLIATETQLAKNRSMPYDFDHEQAKRLREEIYSEAIKNNWIFVLNHSPHTKFSSLDKNRKK